MQTFLPYADFSASAAVLDRARLGKQRVETLQIMKSLALGGGWSNHPATKMWYGNEKQLLEYQRAICTEWTDIRGYKDTCLMKTEKLAELVPGFDYQFSQPSWLGSVSFHAAHRSNLLRKNSEYYSQFEWVEPDNLEYIWPVD